MSEAVLTSALRQLLRKTDMTKKTVNKKQLKGVIAANIIVQAVGLGLFGSSVDGVEVNTSAHAFDRTFVVLKLAIGVSLFVIFSALAYGFGSWAIDSGKFQAYLLTVLVIVIAIRSIVVSVKSCKTPAKISA